MSDDVGVLESEDDFIDKIQQLIENDNEDQVIKEILKLDNQVAQLNALYFLASDIAGDIEFKHYLGSPFDRASVSDLALSGEVVNVRYLVRNLDRALDNARTLDNERDLIIFFSRGHVRNIVRTLHHSLYRFRDRYLDNDRDDVIDLTLVLNYARTLTQAIKKNYIIIAVLDVMMGLQRFRLTGADLTPSTLMREVAPYLSAMATIQAVISDLKDEEFEEPQIESITAGSALIDTSGLGDIVREFRDMFRWRKNKAEVKGLELKNKELELKLEMDQLNLEAIQQRESKEWELTYQERMVALERKRNALARERLTLVREYVESAESLLEPYMPDDISPDKRSISVSKVAGALREIVESNLTLEVDKPKTLPEEKDDDK